MPIPATILKRVAALMNDTEEQQYDAEACLPYLNMALDDLQEEFQLNNIPVTSRTTPAVITVPIDTAIIGFETVPALPENLVEIRQMWESPEGQNTWIPMTKRDYLPHYLDGAQISQFIVWAWLENAINVLPANQAIDLKLDYIKSLFVEVEMGDIDADLGVELKNTTSYLSYRTAAICSALVAQDTTRAEMLQAQAGKSLNISMGISIKGQQSFGRRRRPFRASFKSRNTW